MNVYYLFKSLFYSIYNVNSLNIFKESLRRFKFVIYMEPVKSCVDLLKSTIRNSKTFNRPILMSKKQSLNCYTNKKMFEWFDIEEAADVNANLIDTRVMLFQRDFLTSLMIKIWVTCALDIECIAPSDSSKSDHSGWIMWLFYDTMGCSHTCNCHKFDESAISIINSIFLNALF